ncbi:MAG: hypothetical protein KF779_15100 [Hyphomonadaceae bacterium]|nr:hypothetical protein [Hyphomonadaceae bacterium]MCA8885570.1 hypothetical protein [Hyphomonadaceae bacterium]
MAKSLLSAFVTSTRALLVAQLIACVGAVALAGWTLGVTNQVLRERNRLQERVIQLEEAMAASGVVPPAPAAVVAPAQTDAAYPGSIADARAPNDNTETDDIVASAEDSGQSIGTVITSLFGPAPPLHTVVLHVRAETDVAAAEKIARQLQTENMRTLINVMTARDQRPSGYAYFDGRQSRAAADVVARFHDLAREQEVAQWSAQLRGTALPARDEYTADRLDIVLPPLPPPPPPVVEAPSASATAPPQP